jgi:HSP20 family protein
MSALMPAPMRARLQRRDTDDVYRQMDRMLQQLLDPGAVGPEVWTPPVDIEETDDAWLVEAELPGAKRGDVVVEMQGDELLIRGEIKERERTGIIRRRTRRVGEFEFRVRLPGDVDEAGMEADLHGGLLSVRVPKARAQNRRVAVTGED